MKLQAKRTAVPVNWRKSLFLSGGFAILTLIGFLLAPAVTVSGLIISIVFFILWSAGVFLSVRQGQWLPLLLGSIYLLVASAIRLYADNALQSERGIPTFLKTILNYTDQALNGFSYFSEGLEVVILAILALLTLGGLILVMDRSKPTIIEDTDPIDW